MSTPLPGSSDVIIKEGPFVYLSDWDGTITTQDSNDYLIDNFGMGKENREKLNEDILSHKLNFRDAFYEMLRSVSKAKSFYECMEILKRDIVLDPGFSDFYFWAKMNNIPVIIVSSGMAPFIRSVLSKLIGEEEAKNIDIISNDVKFNDPEGKDWEIVYRHPESGFGHDKSKAILPYRDLPQPPTLFFSGDGVSDMSAAKHADHLYVRKEKDLEKYCVAQNIPYTPFDTFTNIKNYVIDAINKKE
ncbi:hypothetical protein E3Q22_02409 [Wallemia mellicola]|uniref:HAD-like protein n=2 Tax=Wallemia mellicola TaxID=1708541 RepID=A0A4T0RAU8_9BASI|nr:hypothetical protein WALSEDRAFT_32451 [Wallemia mellicola CBS 633.66]TIB72502.1 hypothetical protein E3Q24_01625 [Wallemia mellicola]EIM21913.1 hypothetical protein WALSEDRAFT_32451 [Wallemia mellicola CBS 633.66]TIB77304.1 hypothetical protein E3Q23_01340 [Wallemia mellicola]TIB78880.1 hypothetical protein E3Q22_02409 [Wallemia mellicola]TIB85918.1 hypothetical protein E3Q21_01807 [Wallemia mellicola]|eukprot:XP_006958208.1 hypothetical protein WALSEDRAFT_32451 [Wallemia mellicola CBS 633.66]